MPAPLGIVALSCLVLTTSLTAPAQDDSAAKKAAEAIAKQITIRFLKDREFKGEVAQAEGSAEAVDPEEHVEVKIKELAVFADRALAELSIQARYKFEGRVKIDDDWHRVRGEADVTNEIKAEAEIFQGGDGVTVRAKVTEMKFKVKVRELEPADLPGGEEGFAKEAQSLLNKHREKFIRLVNDWIDEHGIDAD